MEDTQEKKYRRTLIIESSLWERVQAEARRQDSTASRFVRAAIRAALDGGGRPVRKAAE